MGIDKKITFCRKTLGISQEELAALLNISRQAVSRWETGAAMPDTEKIVQLSRVFHVSTDYLLLDEVEEVKITQNKEAAETEKHPENAAENHAEPFWTMDTFTAMRVKERRRKFRIAAWILFLVLGLCVVALSLVLAGFWAKSTSWWITELGRFGTGLFYTGNVGVFIAGFVVMLPGVAGLIYEYKRED